MTVDVAWSLRSECPIPPRLSPYADAVQKWLPGWLRRFDLPSETEGLLAGRFARYAGRLYPDAGESDLRTIAALFTWFFLLDDACDGPHRATGEQVRALRDGVIAVLRHGPDTRPPGFTGPLRGMLADVWAVLHARTTTDWRARFVDAVAHHLDGARTEAANKTTGHLPAVAEYVELRRATSAAYVSYTLFEVVTGRPLPDAVYHHPALRAVAATGNDLLSWFNDLVSLHRDRHTSGGHNLVLAVARERRVPLEAAVEVVARRWRGTMRRFGRLRAAVPSFGPGLDEAVSDYLDGVANSVRGTVDWSLESDRYPTGTGPAPAG